MDDENRWNPAPQNKKTVEDLSVPPSYAHYHMHQGTSTQKSESSDKKPIRKRQRSRNRLGTTIGLAVVFGLVAGIVFQGVNLTAERFLVTDTEQKDQVETAQLTKETTADSKDTQNSAASAETIGSVASVAKTAMPTVVAITSVSIQEIPYYFGFGFSLYIFPILKPSTVILSVAIHPLGPSHSNSGLISSPFNFNFFILFLL